MATQLWAVVQQQMVVDIMTQPPTKSLKVEEICGIYVYTYMFIYVKICMFKEQGRDL